MSSPDVIIVGGGLAGLACARHLHRHGQSFVLLEASDRVGGRVRTDTVEGFTLDRGFQVLLTAYPETRRAFDYGALDLHPFHDGALIRFDGRFHRISDPFRHPLSAPGTLIAPVGTLGDKVRVAWLRSHLKRDTLAELFMRDETTTIDALRQRWGFSEQMIDRFFRPFFGGIFFDRELQASSRMFEFVFKMFAEGQATLPAAGMEALPRQLAADLPQETLRVDTPVTALDGQRVVLDDGTTLEASALVVAIDAPAAQRLIGDIQPTQGRSTTCLYYAAANSPVDEPLLVLNGDGTGPVNNLCVPSDVAPSYAPEGRALISVVVVGSPEGPDDALEQQVREQLKDWFGPPVELWDHVRTVDIPYALPEQRPPFLSPPKRPVRRRAGLYVCGDHRQTASLNGALASGRKAADAVLRDRPTLAAA